MSNDFVKFLVEVVGNLKNKNLKIGKAAWKKLEPFRDVIEKLSCCKTSLGKKKDIVNQKAGFIGALASAVLSSLVSALIAKTTQ